jgi:osmotically-inducible protein OsmY
MVVAVGCAGSRTQESTGEYLDDAAISTKVKSKLLVDENASGLAINVETFKGVVQLSGFVKSELEKQRAEEIATGVDGVRRVENRISVRGS